MVKTWDAASVGSSPTIETSTWGLMPRRVMTVESLTGLVKVSWKAVVGAIWSSTTRVADRVPAVGEPDWKDVWISVARLKPSWSVAAFEMSTR